MINNERWINSLTKKNEFQENITQIDNNRWINTISKKNTYNSVKNYSLIGVLFISGLLFVSAVKNETRNLQKEIYKIKADISTVNFNLTQAILDNEVITSPENISRLAEEYLNDEFQTYKKSQIKNLNKNSQNFTKPIKKSKNLTQKVKIQVAKKIDQKKLEIQKIKELYDDPNKIPEEAKQQLSKKIKEKKVNLKKLYNNPKEIITQEKMQKWAAVQVVKLFLGIPMVPGK